MAMMTIGIPTTKLAESCDVYHGLIWISLERERQIKSKRWTGSHDDCHQNGEMAVAAACYALPHSLRNYDMRSTPALWPWGRISWKPATGIAGDIGRIRELVKAGALIAAEIDRIVRVIERRTK